MMHPRLPAAIVLCLCGAFATACVNAPETSGTTIKQTFDAGLKAYDSGDFAGAYKDWSTITDADLGAMRNVAVMLRTGKGVEKDPTAAQALMRRAAEAGLFTAQADLGDMLLKGEAGPPDPKAALPWLMAAAQQDHPLAQFELGQLYEQGTVVDKNIEEARRLYKAAAADGVKEAADRLAAMPPEIRP